IIFGTKVVALMIELIFDTTIFYILSPYDSLAHVGQWLVVIPANYEHSLALSIISIIIYNAASRGLLLTRVRSLEVTRE
ncbi:MAG: hypothetical protein VX666_03950, partial [Candidatus Thermoplasmatota archaeon]|nr:hypothetical protein [Candidatus Thermoplasmatota archaeon]